MLNKEKLPYDLREKIGYIPQKAFLFSGTVQDNLIMGKKDASLQEMQHALEIAQAKTFIDILPEKLLTLVSQGGTNFSGGQKARLSIARELMGDKPILIMDESTANLDKQTAIQIEQNILSNPTLTVIMITHHLYDESRDLLDQIIQL